MSVALHLSRARSAIFSIFGLNGFLMALWAVHIPVILERTHTSHAALGLLLLLLGVGAFGGMQGAGHLADRFGSKRLVIACTVGGIVSFILLALSGSTLQLAVSMLLFGMGNGGLDVAMNLQATSLEEKYGRPIMSSFHAFFSVGTFLGSIIGYLALHAHVSILNTFIIVGGLSLGVLASCAPHLLLPRTLKKVLRTDSSVTRKLSRSIISRIVLVGSLAFLLMLSEGVANDWSALQIKDEIGGSSAQVALGYAAFAIAMALGRFSADKISGRWGALKVIRYGSLLAACGMLAVVSSHVLWLTLLGWALFGLGLSGSVPQLFTAAGRISSARQGVVVSRVVGMGYIGLLAGPAIIGYLTQFMSLTTTMLLPLAFTLISAVAAHKAINED